MVATALLYDYLSDTGILWLQWEPENCGIGRRRLDSSSDLNAKWMEQNNCAALTEPFYLTSNMKYT